MGGGSAPGSSRIAVCSGDQLRRDALAAHLGTLPDFILVGQVSGGAELIPLVELQRPDIALVDAGPRPEERVPALRELRARFPGIAVVVVYERLTTAQFAAVSGLGLSALVPYAHGLGGLLAVLRTLPNGAWQSANGASALTARQREILLLLRSGHQIDEIAALLAITPGTVENHKRRVYAKLGTPPPRAPVTPPPDARAAAEPHPPLGRPVLAVAVGTPGPVFDSVVTTLITNRMAVVREHGPEAVAQVHWLRTHRGPVVRVLVNPTVDQVQAGAALGWTAVMVHDRPVDRRGMAEALAHGITGLVLAAAVEQQLVPVLNLVAAGYLVLDPTSTSSFTDAMTARSVKEAAPAPSPREQPNGPLFRMPTISFT